MAKEALLIVDMLNDFVREGAPLEVPDNRKILPNVMREIDKAHAEGTPVIYVCDTHAPDDREFSKFGWPPHGVKGTKGAEVVDELKPADGDIILEKTSYSLFEGTPLDEILENFGIKSIRLTGCVTNICIMFGAYEAVLRDYEVTVIEDGVAGLDPKDHQAALRNMKNVLDAKIE